MGATSSAGGIALVVPAYFLCSGILLYTAIIAAVPGLHRGRGRMYLAFAATCVSSACLSFAYASYYLADSVRGGIDAQRWATTAAVLLLASIFAFVGEYTRAPAMRRAYAVAAAIAAVLIVASFSLPFGVRYASVERFEYLHLPWGESLFHLDGTPGALNLVVRLLALGLVVWAVWRLLVFARGGERRDATVFAVYLMVLLAATFQGALVDLGIVKSFYWIPFALVGLAMLMGVNLLVGLRDQNKALADAARTDELTGLPNRPGLRERLRLLLERGPASGHGAVLECDLDHFKVINDALGQEVGDSLLREVSRRLEACARERATVARIGGNTFVLLTDTRFASEPDARAAIDALAADVTRALAMAFQVEERSLAVTASMGVATFHARESEAAEVMARADTAVERAKRRGRNNTLVFEAPMQREAAERFRVVDGLRRAIERGELALAYQPLVDSGGRVSGVEALLRWRSAELGDVSPATFIPVAEESGLIHALGAWSLRTGCERIAAWRDGGLFSGYLAVNVSPWQLAHPGFVGRLREQLAASGVPRGAFTLEVTESAVLVDAADAVAKLKEIRALGVNVALDDFGTGYSSLALVKDLPLDLIKIDQSFVRGLRGGANRHLVRMIVAIGAELGIEVLAEGVETAADREELLALGCTRFQGYHFARPMAEPELMRWLAARATAAVTQA